MKQMEQTGIIKQTAVTVTAAIICMAMICGLTGFLVSKEVVKMELAEKMVMAAMVAGTFAACWNLARKQSRKRLIIAVLISVMIAGICLLGKALFFGHHVIQWQTVLLVLGTGVLSGIVSGKKKTKRYHNRNR